MNTTPQEARAELGDALKPLANGEHKIRYFTDISATVDPPATTVGPPALSWETQCSEPTSATFVVYLIVSANARAVDQLLELLPTVTAALETVDDAAVVSASPGVYVGGGSELPAYEILTEVAL